MTCAKRREIAAGPNWKGKIGCIFSAGALEHCRPEELEVLIETMRESLAEPFRSAPERDLDCLVTPYLAKLRA